MRSLYGMSNPHYAVISGYKTRLIQQDIVEAVTDNLSDLTGLLVGVDPSQWGRLDALEGAYDRVLAQTTMFEECWIYVSKYN